MDTTVLLVDDHPVFREGLRHLIENSKGIKVVGEAADGQAAIELVRQLSPQVVVMDISMPDFNGIEATEQIVSEHPQTKVMALSIHSGKRFVEGMLRAGAAGYVLKESAPEELVRGIRSVQQGEVFLSAAISGVVVAEYLRVLSRNGTSQDRVALTDREQRVLHLMAKGSADADIRATLGLSAKVVASTQKRIMTKLGLSNAAELMEHLRATQWSEGEALLEIGRPNGHTHQGPSQPILATKLHHPPTYLEVVPRTDLLKQLEEGRQRRLTLVSAPAGYGKSTLVSQWLATCSGPAAWLSLDDSDNDLRLFLTYLLCAIQSAAPMAGQMTRSLLEAPNLPSPSDLARYLLADLDEVTEPFILVLDDYHHIHIQPVHELLSALIDHNAPVMHLVLVTRRDPPLPITRLRARDQLTEIALQQLRFTPAETEVFLREVLRAPVTEAMATLAEQKTEGWVTGLRLITLSLRDREDLDRVVGSLSGEFHRIAEYLFEEVLSRQPAAMKRYLLQTSILKQFCAPLCEAIDRSEGTPGEGSETVDGQAFVRWLQDAHLFAVPLDEQRRWFRYHHLFAQLLRKQLGATKDEQEIATLHTHAARWFTDNGYPENAIDHALAAGDVALAKEVFDDSRINEINNDRWHLLERWCGRFPEQIRNESAPLLLTQAWICIEQHRLSELPAIAERVKNVLPAGHARSDLQGEQHLLQGELCYWQADAKRGQQHLRKALELFGADKPLFRGEAFLHLGLARQMAGQSELAVRDLNTELRQTSADNYALSSRLAAGLAFVHLFSGELRQALQATLRLDDAAQRGGVGYLEAWSAYLQGLVPLHLADMEGAIASFTRAVERRHTLHTRAAVDSFVALAYAHASLGQADEAAEALERLSEFATATRDPQNVAVAHSARCRLALLGGNDSSEWSVQSLDTGPEPPGMFLWLENPSITRCRLLLSTGRKGEVQQAESTLDTFCKQAKALHNIAQLIEMMTLQALALATQKREAQATNTLDQVLSLAQPGGWVRPFVEAGAPMVELLERLPGREQTAGFVQQILRACGTRVGSSAPHEAEQVAVAHPLVESLTNRERAILELLPDRLYDKEIAEKLFISVATVKTHLKHIYQKLDVKNRRQAVGKAAALGLVARDSGRVGVDSREA